LILLLLFLFPRFLPTFFFNLILEKTFQHIFFLTNSMYPFFLLFIYPLMKRFYLFLLELVSLVLSVPLTYRSLVIIDILQFLLIFYEVVIVLLIYGIFLGLYLTSYHHFLVIFFFLFLLLLFLFRSHLLPNSQFLKSRSFLVLHNLLPPHVILLHGSPVILMHLALLLHHSSPLLLSSSFPLIS
jgi:hypothetical protein